MMSGHGAAEEGQETFNHRSKHVGGLHIRWVEGHRSRDEDPQISSRAQLCVYAGMLQ